MPASPTAPSTPAYAASESAGDVVRWGAFSCGVVSVVLVVYGTSVGGATVTALGLAAVTAVCRLLLRRSERGSARLLADPPTGPAEPPGPRILRFRTTPGAHRGARHGTGNAAGARQETDNFVHTHP